MRQRKQSVRLGGRRWSVRQRCVELLEGRQLFSGATVVGDAWQIVGDANRRSLGDVIVVAPVENDPSTLKVTIDGVDAGTTPVGAIRSIHIDAGKGDDRVTVDVGPTGSSLAVTILGGAGNDRITGSGVADVIYGGAGDDRIDGGGGNDTLYGDAGRDQLLGGEGDDTLYGGGGNDVVAGAFGGDSLFGEKGIDRLRGGDGDDLLDGGIGNDRMIGGSGADTFAGGKGADHIASQDGVDVFAAAAGSGSSATVTDSRDVVTADNVSEPATRQTDDAQLKQWLIDAAVKQWMWAFGQEAYPWGFLLGVDGEVMVTRRGDGAPPPTPVPTPTPAPGVPPVVTTTPSPTPSPAPVPGRGTVGGDFNVGGSGAGAGTGSETASDPDDHSDTNTQVAGVDEADLVETDGTYIYALEDNNLAIVTASPADGMTLVSSTPVEGNVEGIYLRGDRLTVVSSSYSWRIMPLEADDRLSTTAGGDVAGREIIAPPSEPPTAKVFVTVFDVSNRAAPTQIEKTSMDGTYGGSRLIQDRLYMQISNDTWVPAPVIIPNPTPSPTPTPTPPPIDDEGGVNGDGTITTTSIAPIVDGRWAPGGSASGVYESEASYRARLEAMPLSDLLPGYSSTATGGDSSGLLVSSATAYVRDIGTAEIGQNLTTIALLNIGDTAGGPIATSTVAGFGGQMYASADALYIAGTQWTDDAGPSTRLMKFQLGPDSVPLQATGSVDGTVLNQFSMDDDGDNFRIATTGWDIDSDRGIGSSTNSLFVLDQVGDELETVGSITGIKKGEQLRSARFVGDRAYLVTFRRVDPLFSVNLDDPTKPRITGELVIPGFSSYLQPIGEGLLLGLGRDIDPDTQADRGLQLSLFDVSDDANPKRLDAFNLTDDWGSSEAEGDHHAFAYFADQQILALPVNSWAGDIDVSGSFASTTRLMVLKIDATKGGDAISKIGAPTPPDGVRRSVRIGEVLYAVGTDRIQSMVLQNPEQVIGSVKLGND